MNKQELIQSLKNQYKSFSMDVEALNESEFMKAATGKWSAGQHLDHLCRSLSPLVLGLKLPSFIPKLLFGKANRPSKTYQDLVDKYLRKIDEGAKASGPYVPPKAVSFSKKKALLKQLKDSLIRICTTVEAYSEKQLDQIILPHPLLGKVTLREMLYFTVYHAEHHRQLVEKGLKSGK
jgi:hypothetical protein